MKVLMFAVLLAVFAFQPAYAQKTATVITQGLGKDIESAVQRGAEAALIQVVGSFIGSRKLIEKRKEIRNGIKRRTKSISSKISEYSQGSIKRLDVLDVIQEDGLIQVTTKVTIRIEDFKRYIKETVLAERMIKRGLLARLKTGRKQETNLVDLLIDNVFRPVLDYKVVVPKLGEISAITDPKEIAWVLKATASRKESTRIERGLKPSFKGYVVSFNVDVNLKTRYLQNATRVLRKTADKNLKGNVKSTAVSALITLWECGHLNTTCYNRGWDSSPSESYGFPARHGNLCASLGNLFTSRKVKTRWGGPKLKLQFVSNNGLVIREEIFNKRSKTVRLFPVSSFSAVLPRKKDEPFSRHKLPTSFHATSLLYYSEKPRVGDGPCEFRIKKSVTFRIVSKVTEDLLGKSDKIVLSYIQ